MSQQALQALQEALEVAQAKLRAEEKSLNDAEAQLRAQEKRLEDAQTQLRVEEKTAIKARREAELQLVEQLEGGSGMEKRPPKKHEESEHSYTELEKRLEDKGGRAGGGSKGNMQILCYKSGTG